MSEEQVEYVVDNVEEKINVKTLETWKVDTYIKIIKDNNEDLKRYKEILEKQVDELNSKFEDKKNKIDKENRYLLVTLGQFAKLQPSLKTTKTKHKYTSLQGNIEIKRQIPKVSKPEKDVYDKIKELYPEFVEEVKENKVDWKELKKKFIIQNGKIFDKETGEQIEEVFSIETNDEEITVK